MIGMTANWDPMSQMSMGFEDPMMFEPKKSKRCLWLLVFLILVILAAAGGGYWYYVYYCKEDSEKATHSDPSGTEKLPDEAATSKIDDDKEESVTNEQESFVSKVKSYASQAGQLARKHPLYALSTLGVLPFVWWWWSSSPPQTASNTQNTAAELERQRAAELERKKQSDIKERLQREERKAARLAEDEAREKHEKTRLAELLAEEARMTEEARLAKQAEINWEAEKIGISPNTVRILDDKAVPTKTWGEAAQRGYKCDETTGGNCKPRENLSWMNYHESKFRQFQSDWDGYCEGLADRWKDGGCTTLQKINCKAACAKVEPEPWWR